MTATGAKDDDDAERITTIYEAPRNLSDEGLIAKTQELRALKDAGEAGVDFALDYAEYELKRRGLTAE